METQQEPTKADAVVAPSGVAGEPVGSGGVLENQKSKADNRAEQRMSSVRSWENTRKPAVEAKLRTREEKLEKKKAEYGEKMRNRIAMIHKEAEEQRAAVEARRQEEMIKCQEMAAKHRSKGTTPAKKFLSCFG